MIRALLMKELEESRQEILDNERALEMGSAYSENESTRGEKRKDLEKTYNTRAFATELSIDSFSQNYKIICL